MRTGPSVMRAVMVAGLMVMCAAAVEAAEFIVKDGKPNAQIVIAAEGRPRMATLAALELQRGIQQISGARLPIVTTHDANIPVKIYVGRSDEAMKRGVTDEGLKYGAFRIASGKDWLALVGNDWDFVPEKFKVVYVSDSAEKWQKIPGSPYRKVPKHYWNPNDFDKVLDEYYGEGSAKVWKTGGDTAGGFYSGDVAGSVSAVADFLYGLGVRFYMPNDELGTVMPKLASIPLPELNKTVNPDFPCRYWYWYKYRTFPLEEILWARRLGINEGSGFYSGVHGLNMVHGQKEMQKAHPEYYAIIGGEREFKANKGRGTPCFSSEGFFKETVNYCRFMFDEMNRRIVDLMPGDGLQQCQCDGCKKKTSSEMVWEFINRVAAELYKTHPDHLVNCGAYASYRVLPDTIEKFSPNVMISIYNYGRSAFNDPDVWDHYTKNMGKFESKLAPRRIRRGENNLTNGRRGALVGFPIIFPRAMAKDLAYLKGRSFGDGAECPQYRGHWTAPGVNHLALYVQARFLMNAEQDIDTLLDEYYSRFYGPAAEEMREAFTYAEDNMATKDRSKSGGRRDITNVPLEAKLRVRELLDRARDAAGDGVYGQRVEKIISEMKPREQVLAEDRARREVMAERAVKAPLAIGVESADLGKAREYPLVNARTGEAPEHPTSFKLGWDKNALLVDVTCMEPDMKNVRTADPVYQGDYVAVALETPLHTYYLLHISPDGKLWEGNPAPGHWSSLAEVTSEKGADSWRLKIRIPCVSAEEAEADPNHRVAGEKPTAENPWYFMVGRYRVRGGDRELQSFNKQTGGWKALKYYGKLEVR